MDSTSGCDLLSFLDAYSGFHGYGDLAATPLSEGPDPGQWGLEEPRPSGNPEPLGAQGPDMVEKGELDPDRPKASLLRQRSPPRGKGQVS